MLGIFFYGLHVDEMYGQPIYGIGRRLRSWALALGGNDMSRHGYL